MKKLYSVDQGSLDYIYISLLDKLSAANIPYMEKNNFLAGVIFSLGYTEKEIWIIDATHYADGKKILSEIINILNSKEIAEDWTCPQCKERIEGNFDICWNCGCVRS